MNRGIFCRIGVLCRRAPAGIAALAIVLGCGAASAAAATPAPGWSISSVALPTNFSARNDAACSSTVTKELQRCNSLAVTIRNAGSRPSSGAVTIRVTLPAGLGLTVTGIESGAAAHEENQLQVPLSCEIAALTCTTSEPVPSGAAVEAIVHVEVAAGASGSGTASTSVEGGGAATASSSSPITVSEQTPPFELTNFSFQSLGLDGAADTQAGDHPYAVTTSFQFSTVTGGAGSEEALVAVHEPKEVAVDLPLGMVGDPQAAEKCPEYDMATGGEPVCPASSQVGTIGLSLGTTPYSSGAEYHPIYNVIPEAGYPAEFGFVELGRAVIMYASVVRVGAGYDIRVTVPGIPRALGSLKGISLTFFGDPSEHDGDTTLSQAFFTNPVDCAGGGQSARIEADSWEEPDDWATAESALSAPTGCDLLQFQPTLTVTPEATQADTPEGYTVNLAVPQATNLAPVLATPELKDATVTLPEGVAVNPGAAEGLQGCSNEAFDVASTEPAGCPSASQIGTVKITTPLLTEPLEGQIYLGSPECSPCSEADAREGHIFRLFLQAQGSGVRIKLPGTVAANVATGQLTATFTENPQLPFSDLMLTFTGGATAPLANPQSCGIATTSSDLSPWSEPLTVDATPTSSFQVSGCSSVFKPSFDAGTVSTQAGAYTPFTLTFSRVDGEQDLSQIAVNTPPGLLGMLSKVPLCGEPQAVQGTCSAASQIGTTTVAAGAGSRPFWLSGKVYLTGPYKGQPFGLSIVVPAIAGPFNLGTVVVRASIAVNPTTSALTITSDPLPQIVDGVPIRLQTVNVTVNRGEFMFNPTSCAAGQAVSATITGEQGADAPVSDPLGITGCKSLPFKPTFSASTQASASGLKDGNGASLKVKIGYASGQANIKRVDVTLPEQLPARLIPTLQNACSEAQFAADPAGCPPDSFVGTATAVTPVLNVPLTGPAIFVSHGGAAFPDLDVVLQGQGVTIDLTGHTLIKGKITYSKFETVPDAPISSFELNLPEGPHSALASGLALSKHSLCGQELLMPTMIEGQNGAVAEQTTKIAIVGCGPALYIRSHKISGKTVTVTVTVPSAGRIVASGTGLAKQTKKPTREKLVTFKLKLTKAQAAKVSKKHRLKTKVKLAFTPKKGKKLSTSVAVTFK